MMIDEAQKIPKFYGVAYYCLRSPNIVVYPIPFNLIVGCLMRIFIFFKQGFPPIKREIELREAWFSGFSQGFEYGKKFEITGNRK